MNKKILLLATVSLLGLSSCDSFLDKKPIDYPVEKTFYTTVNGLRGGLIGVYDKLQSGSAFGGNFIVMMEKRGDNVKAENAGAGGGLNYEISFFSDTPANANIWGVWVGLYSAIERCNKILSATYNVKMTEKEKNEIVGQASFLRALSYFYLVRLYGEVPVITKSQTVEEARKNKRNSISEVYAQIVSDLQNALSLPKSWPDTQRGKPTYYAAQALLGKVYLYMKDYPKVISALEPVVEAISKGNDISLVPSNLTFPSNIKVSKDVLFAILYLNGGFGEGVSQNNRYRNNDNSSHIILPQSLFENADNRKPLVAPTGSGKLPAKFNGSSVNGNTSGDMPVLRCAEVMLLYAEALNELNGPDDKALAALNSVRQNADITLKKLSDLSTKELFRKEVWLQRRLELALECDRWFDIVRTDQMSSVNPDVPAFRQYYPIPQRQLENIENKDGWQNPGYTNI